MSDISLEPVYLFLPLPNATVKTYLERQLYLHYEIPSGVSKMG